MLETLEGDTVATVVIAFLVAGIFKGALGMGLPKISVAIMGVACLLYTSPSPRD